MIVTPRELSLRSELYHQVGSMVKAGLPILSAMEQLQRNPPSRAFREPLRTVLFHLNQGDTFAGAMGRTGDWIPSFDLALLESGEKSGRLPECFGMLAGYYKERAELINSLLMRLAYPVFLIHLAVLIFPVTQLTELVREGNVGKFLLLKALMVVPLYGVVFLIALAGQSRHGEAWRATVENLLHLVPLLGRARRCLAVARLSAALEALFMAGVNTVEAWEMAAKACGSPVLRRTVLKWRPQIEAGTQPSELVSRAGVFGDLFANLYHSGEVSGKLDESLRRLYDFHLEEGTRKMRLFLTGLTTGIILLTMIAVAAQIIMFYVGYFNQALSQ